MTYSNNNVATTIGEHFEPVQINTQDGTPTTAELVARFHQVWSPDLRVLSADGDELYAWGGFLPAEEFLPKLLAASAHALMRLARDGEAAAAYQHVVDTFPQSSVAAEACYYGAVAAYRSSHQANDLLDGWAKLQTNYPGSIWRTKQSFIEDNT